MLCACGSQKDDVDCCERYISGKEIPPSPEALMRSRYTAYTKCLVDYLRETLAPESRRDFNAKEVQEWSKTSEWLGLEIVKVQGNVVEFNAKYKAKNGKVLEHHEVSTFKKEGGRWYFVDGDSHTHEAGHGHHHHHHHEPIMPLIRGDKIGRNDPCTCGSGKKYKKCCGAAA